MWLFWIGFVILLIALIVSWIAFGIQYSRLNPAVVSGDFAPLTKPFVVQSLWPYWVTYIVAQFFIVIGLVMMAVGAFWGRTSVVIVKTTPDL